MKIQNLPDTRMTLEKFWVFVARLAVRRAYKRGRIPVGLPGNRDPDNPCREYFPVLKPSGDGPCLTDGHYLCAECEWHARECED